MTIQPNTSIDNSDPLDTRKPAQQQRGSNTSTSNDQSPAAEALSAFSIEESDGPGALDSTGADQLLQGLLQNISGNFNSAVTAHTGLNSNSVLDLIQ